MSRAPNTPRRGLGSLALALGFAALLAALSLVVWRQSRALESLRALEAVTGERDLAEAERFELLRRIQHLESRSRIEPYAQEQLGLHVPTGSGELVLLRIDQAPDDGDPVSGEDDEGRVDGGGEAGP